MRPAIATLKTLALTWLAVFGALQLVITNYGVLKSGGDIESAIAKTAGCVAWLGVCLYLINNAPQFIANVGDSIFSVLGVALPDAGSIMTTTFGWAASLLVLAVPAGIASNVAGNAMLDVALLILGVGMFVAFKIFMLHLELGLVVMLSPLSLSFLGLNALKEQGIAPFKSLLALAYRIILLTIILATFTQVGTVAKTAFVNIANMPVGWTGSGIGDIISAAMAALGAYLVLFFLVWKSDSIAASLASGSVGLGTSDVAGAAAAGAAAGMAIHAAGSAGAAKIPSPMPSLGGGSIKNAGGSGSGGGGGASGASSGGASLSMPPGSPGATPPAAESPFAGTTKDPSYAGGAADKETSGPNLDAPASSGAGGGGGGQPSMDKQIKGDASRADAAASSGGDVVGAADKRSRPGGQAGNIQEAKNFAATNPGAPKTSEQISDAAARLEPTQTAGGNTAPGTGSGANSGIGGSGSKLETDLGKLVDHLTSQQDKGPAKPSLGDRLKDVNQHVSQEKAHTSVSINTHHSD